MVNNTPNNRPQQNRDDEVQSVVGKMRDALEALRKTVTNPEADDAANETLQEQGVEDLVRVIAENKDTLLDSGLRDPETLKLIEQAAAGMSMEDVTNILDDAQSVDDDLDVFSDEIAEMNNIAPPEKLPLHERLSRRIESFLSEKFPKEKMQEIAKKYGIELNDEDAGKMFRKVVNIIKAGFISMLEKIPTMESTSRNWRWSMALEEAREGDILTSEQKASLDNPDELSTVRSKWNQLYMQWLSRKKATQESFTEPPPSLADAFKGIELEEGLADENLFDVEGLKQNEEKKIEKETKLSVNNKALELYPDNIVLDGQKRKFKENIEGVYITAPDANVENVNVRIAVNGESVEITVKELVEKIEQAAQADEVALNATPSLSLEAVS